MNISSDSTIESSSSTPEDYIVTLKYRLLDNIKLYNYQESNINIKQLFDLYNNLQQFIISALNNIYSNLSHITESTYITLSYKPLYLNDYNFDIDTANYVATNILKLIKTYDINLNTLSIIKQNLNFSYIQYGGTLENSKDKLLTIKEKLNIIIGNLDNITDNSDFKKIAERFSTKIENETKKDIYLKNIDNDMHDIKTINYNLKNIIKPQIYDIQEFKDPNAVILNNKINEFNELSDKLKIINNKCDTYQKIYMNILNEKYLNNNFTIDNYDEKIQKINTYKNSVEQNILNIDLYSKITLIVDKYKDRYSYLIQYCLDLLGKNIDIISKKINDETIFINNLLLSLNSNGKYINNLDKIKKMIIDKNTNGNELYKFIKDNIQPGRTPDFLYKITGNKNEFTQIINSYKENKHVLEINNIINNINDISVSNDLIILKELLKNTNITHISQFDELKITLSTLELNNIEMNRIINNFYQMNNLNKKYTSNILNIDEKINQYNIMLSTIKNKFNLIEVIDIEQIGGDLIELSVAVDTFKQNINYTLTLYKQTLLQLIQLITYNIYKLNLIKDINNKLFKRKLIKSDIDEILNKLKNKFDQNNQEQYLIINKTINLFTDMFNIVKNNDKYIVVDVDKPTFIDICIGVIF